MPKDFNLKALMIVLIFYLAFIMKNPKMLISAEELNEIRIVGLVKRPLTLTYSDLLAFPMVSEMATCYCPFDDWEVTFNWTGVPVFHLLTLAEVEPEGASVYFQARDGYTANLRMVEVLKPTTILAIKGNGTILSDISGREGGFRVVFPCKDGYQWVTNITEIRVTKDFFENVLDQDKPNCVSPSMDPPLLSLNLTLSEREFQTRFFTNALIAGFDSNYKQKQLYFNVTVSTGKTGFIELIMPNTLLRGPYSVFLDEEPVEFRAATVANLTFIHLVSPEEFHRVRIVGEEIYKPPDDTIESSQIQLGLAGITSISTWIVIFSLLGRKPELSRRILDVAKLKRNVSCGRRCVLYEWKRK